MTAGRQPAERVSPTAQNLKDALGSTFNLSFDPSEWAVVRRAWRGQSLEEVAKMAELVQAALTWDGLIGSDETVELGPKLNQQELDQYVNFLIAFFSGTLSSQS